MIIQNESRGHDLADRDRELETLRADRERLFQIRLIRAMDKLIEHPEFGGAISRIRHVAFVSGEESG